MIFCKGCDPKVKDRLERTPFTELGEPRDSVLLELLEWGESLQSTPSQLLIQ